MRNIYRNTKRKEKLNFMLNNTWNLYSQSRNSAKETRDFRKMDSLNASGLQFVQVISWHPCAYDCPKSRTAADRIYDFMSHYVPEHAAMLKKRLSKPVVMLDKYKFIAFNGFIAGRTLYHAGAAAIAYFEERGRRHNACQALLKAGFAIDIPNCLAPGAQARA